MSTKMVFDPAICCWDRPGAVYGDGVRIFRKDKDGQVLWAREATSEEVLWIAEYEQRHTAIYLLETLLELYRNR